MSIEEIEAGLKDWDFLDKLPPSINDFKLTAGTGISGQILNIASYVHGPSHCRVDLTYTQETFDYVPVKTVGLHSFRDMRYFCRDRERFAQQMLLALPALVDSVNRNKPHALSCAAQPLHFENWDFWRSLPQNIEGCELFITPDNPLEYINGSVIFLDYTDFAHGNQLYFAYNVYRDELFAEMRRGGLPQTTAAFDVKSTVPDASKLAALEVLIEQKLQPILASLKK